MTEISIDKHPGRLLRERLPDGKTLKAKMYLVGQRLYQIAVTMPRADTTPDGGKSYEKFADKFLDSFKLISEQEAAVKAAREARFALTLLEGKPVKVLGVINYNFENIK
jgi:hypothetical protein